VVLRLSLWVDNMFNFNWDRNIVRSIGCKIRTIMNRPIIIFMLWLRTNKKFRHHNITIVQSL